jgi:hypothetical protein
MYDEENQCQMKRLPQLLDLLAEYRMTPHELPKLVVIKIIPASRTACVLLKCCSNDQSNNSEMDGTSSTYGGEEKCIQGFGKKT